MQSTSIAAFEVRWAKLARTLEIPVAGRQVDIIQSASFEWSKVERPSPLHNVSWASEFRGYQGVQDGEVIMAWRS